MTTEEQVQHDAGAAAEPLPQQEEYYRPPARFGNVPVARTPLGWDPRNPGFRNHYPVVNLPTQIVERVTFGAPELEPNRLIWGDCLHVMRQLPSESIDLIYIDPPFFSNRNYNVIWGDDNEERSFSDIWEGGLDGYLIWLNARLYEMKRLLTKTGSIYVHCDWHASHYIKVEMDKIFGYENFRNEIVWHYAKMSNTTRDFPRNHDVILRYTRTSDSTFHPTKGEDSEYRNRFANFLTGNQVLWGDVKHKSDKLVTGRAEKIQREFGRVLNDSDVLFDFDEEFKTQSDVLYVSIIRGNAKERIGYPTQKPEALLERIIKASSNEGDAVADFFLGGGTTTAVAQRLGRCWIACDQSRVAVAITAERLKQQAMTRGLEDASIPDFTIEQWAIYEADRLSQMPPNQFRRFVLDCYDARIPSDDEGIHGYKGERARVPVWIDVPSLTAPVTVEDVNEFAQAIARLPRYTAEEGLRDGIMLAWGFAPDAAQAAQELRERGAADIAFVRLEQVRIDSPAFRQHIALQSTERGDYSQFLTFVQPPDVTFAHRRLKPLHYGFDASDTQAYNADAKIINVQWDFNYDGRTFHAVRRPWAERGALTAQHTFPRAGVFTVACKVQDDKGGEGMRSARVEVN